MQKITAFDGGIYDYFGSLVKISNNPLFIREANSVTTENLTYRAVYIYNYNGSDKVFSKKIVTDGTSNIDMKINLLITSDCNQNQRYADVSFYKKNGNKRKFTSTLSLGNLEEHIVDFSIADNNIYSINRNINSTISIAEYDEFINGEWVLYNYFPN